MFEINTKDNNKESNQSDFCCLNPWNYLFISNEGNCYFCCSDFLKDDYCIGNIFEQDIKDIWNSEKAQQFRKDILDKKYSHCDLKACSRIYKRFHKIFQQIPDSNPLIAPLPIYIQLNHDFTCAQRCIFCRDTINTFSKQDEKFWDETAESKFFPAFSNIKILSLLGSGEVFDSAHSKRLLKRVMDSFPDVKVEIWSNAVNFTKENVEKLNLNGRIRSLHFSIHAADAETYKKIWRTDNFDKVKKNLEYAAQLNKDGQLEEFIITSVVSRKNYKNMKKFVLMAKELGAIASLTLTYKRNTYYTSKDEFYAVFKPNHFLYNDFVKKIQDPVFKQENVFFDFDADLKPVSNWRIFKNFCIDVKTEVIAFILKATKETIKLIKQTKEKIKVYLREAEKKRQTYVSCDYIQYGVNFDLDSIRICRFEPFDDGGKPVLISEYNGGTINWKEILKQKRKIKKLNKKGKFLDCCKGCSLLQKKEWKKGDFISYFDFNHWTDCNSQCCYCDFTQNSEDYKNKKNYKVLNEIENLYKQGLVRFDGHVSFVGAEPTRLDEFEPLLNFFIDNGMELIYIYSSGIDFSDTVSKGITLGLLRIIVSVDAGTSETYFKIKNVDKFHNVWENISKYASCQKDDTNLVRTKYLIVPGMNDNINDLEQFLSRTKESGVNSVIFDIEYDWYQKNMNNIPVHIYELFDYIFKRLKELQIENYEVYGFVQKLLANREKFCQKSSPD